MGVIDFSEALENILLNILPDSSSYTGNLRSKRQSNWHAPGETVRKLNIQNDERGLISKYLLVLAGCLRSGNLATEIHHAC